MNINWTNYDIVRLREQVQSLFIRQKCCKMLLNWLLPAASVTIPHPASRASFISFCFNSYYTVQSICTVRKGSACRVTIPRKSNHLWQRLTQLQKWSGCSYSHHKNPSLFVVLLRILSPGQTDSQVFVSNRKLNLRRDLRRVDKRTRKFTQGLAERSLPTFVLFRVCPGF